MNQPTELETVLAEIRTKLKSHEITRNFPAFVGAANIYGLENFPLDFLIIYSDLLGRMEHE